MIKAVVLLAFAMTASAAIVTSRSSQYFAQTHNAWVAPSLVQYVLPSSAQLSQITQYAPLLAPAPLVTPSLVPQQKPSVNPAPNPDSESVDIESAKVMALPQPKEQQKTTQVGIQEAQKDLARLQEELRGQNVAPRASPQRPQSPVGLLLQFSQAP